MKRSLNKTTRSAASEATAFQDTNCHHQPFYQHPRYNHQHSLIHSTTYVYPTTTPKSFNFSTLKRISSGLSTFCVNPSRLSRSCMISKLRFRSYMDNHNVDRPDLLNVITERNGHISKACQEPAKTQSWVVIRGKSNRTDYVLDLVSFK